jgi:hypothetical protein
MKQLQSLFVVFFAVFAVTICSGRVSNAQTGIYGGFSGAHITAGPETGSYGALLGVYAQSEHGLHFGGDFRSSLLFRNGFNYYTFAVGPRLAPKPPVLPLRPYVEGLVGGAWYNNGPNTSSSGHFGYHVVVGADWTVFPHFDWRVLEYDYSGNTGSIKAHILSTGLVFRMW